jgi:hypothetical protein
MKSMTLNDLYTHFEALEQLPGVEVLWYPLLYHAGDYVFPKIASVPIQYGDKVLMIGAGIHGDEFSGPITLAEHGRSIIERAHSRGLKVILYPLRNPSAYGIPGKRYNVDSDDRTVTVGNNDFVRYRLADGRIVDDLGPSDSFRSWGWASDPEFQVALPQETRLMHDLLRQDPLSQVRGVLDLHQDCLTPHAAPAAYHYSFGDLSAYEPIVQEIERVIPIWRHRDIGAGYVGLDEQGQVTRNSPDQAIQSDASGFIVRHDGTWTDLMYRIAESERRSIYCITPETTGSTPLDLACQVNLIWINGMIDLIAGS